MLSVPFGLIAFFPIGAEEIGLWTDSLLTGTDSVSVFKWCCFSLALIVAPCKSDLLQILVVLLGPAGLPDLG